MEHTFQTPVIPEKIQHSSWVNSDGVSDCSWFCIYRHDLDRYVLKVSMLWVLFFFLIYCGFRVWETYFHTVFCKCFKRDYYLCIFDI